jgi:hypothetical protein
MPTFTADARLRRLFSLVAVLALASGILAAVVRADGYRAPEFELHDGGIWVTQRSSGLIGRLNTELEVIDTRTGAGGSDQDVLQSGSTVLVLERQPDRVRPLNVRTAKYGTPAELPPNAHVKLGGRTAAVLDPTNGGLWIVPGGDVSSQGFTQAPPRVLAGAAAIAVGLDGTVHALVLSPERSEVVRFRADGKELDRKPVDAGMKPAQITAVGSTSVVLDPASGAVAVPGARKLDAASLGTNLRLQDPGPAGGGVLVSSDRQFGEVPLDGATPVSYWSGGGGNPIAPVRLGSCAWAAWQEQPAKARICKGSVEDAGRIDDPQVPPNSPLQFRVNRNRIVLNQLVTGTVLVVDDGESRRVDDWSQALAVTDNDDGSRDPNALQAVLSAQQSRQGGGDQNAQRSAQNVPPKAFDDTATTRERRPVIVRVLDNDVDPGDVLVVDSVDAVGPEVGVVGIVANGTAVQFTPAASRTVPAVFRYTVSDGRGGTASARVTVTIRPRGSNAAPEAVRDAAAVDAGRSVTVNVLGNDRDADGDAITLTKVSAPQGTVQFRPDGTVVFNAPGTAGAVVVTYEIADELNAVATGELRVDVRAPANLPPVAVSDHVEAFVDREAVVNVLANDSDPNGDAMTVFRVDNPSPVSVQWLPNGEMRLRGEQPGSYLLAYDVTDGPTVASAVVRVDVKERGTQRPPVAVRDDVVLRSGTDTLAPVLANDYDPDGDVLVIERVESDLAGRGLLVETVEHRALRLTALSPLTESVSFTYTVSDGTAQAVGTVVVRSVPGGVNQPPIANRDEITLRAGNVTGIRVLANDVDPDGDELSVTAVTDVPPTDGVLFRQSNQLRYQAPEVERGAVQARYTVADSAGNKADGEVIIHVTPKDASRNSPPAAATLEARVVAGNEVTIKVPLVGVDPEGDAVTFLGFGEPPTLGTIVETGPSSMRYAAARESAGTDRFTYRLRDSLGAEATGSVLVGVIAPPSANSAPVAVPDRAKVKAGETVRVDVLGNDSDPDGDPIELVPDELGKPSRGSVRIEDGAVLFSVPAGTAAGEVSFDYAVVDSKGASARSLATVEITAQPEPVAPIARDDTASPQVAGATVNVDVLENDEDPDGDVRRLQITVDQPGVSVVDGRLRFTMADRAMSFSYEVTDPQKLSARAFVQVPLAAEPDLPPVAAVDRAETEFNQTVKVSVLENDNDPEGKSLSLTKVVGVPRNGTAEIQGSQVLFSPQKDFAGEGGFSYEVSDGKNTAQGSAVVVVKAQANRPPKFTALSVEIPASGRRDVNLANAVTDPDAGDRHTFSNARSDKDTVSVTLNGATLSVSASSNARGTDARVTVDISDGKPEGTAQGVVSVRVLANEKPLPSAVRDTATTDQEKPVTIPVLANDVDPVGQGLRLDSASASAGGTPVVQGDQVVFTPAAGFFGAGSFTYTMFDKTGEAERTGRGTVDVTVIGRPSAPPAPTGTVRSKGVTLQWAVPAANGGPIQGYEVQTSAGAMQSCVAVSETSCSIDGLTNGTTYRFQVRAKNRAGVSDWSAPSPDLVPDVLPGGMQAPTGRFGDRSVAVQWVAPANDGTPISEYTLEVSPPPASGAASQTLPGGTTATTWSGLANGTAYRFRVKAKNGAGTTEFSAYSNAEIPAGAPSAPAAPSATKGDRQATVNWTEPPTNGDAIQRYELQVKKAGSLDRTEAISDPTVRSKVVTAENGSSYTFAIRAENKAGWSAWSPDSTALVPCGKAAAVTGVSATEGDLNSTLAFGAPADNGCAITSYRYQPTGGSPQTLASSRVVSGLTNGTSYSFQVQACNSEGCGDFGPASNTITPYGVPGQPSVSGSVNGQTLNWNWTTPSANGRPVTEFRVYLDGGLVQQGMSTSFSRSFGYSERHTVAVEAVNLRGASSRGSSAVETAGPPPTVGIEKSGTAQGQPGCSSSLCAYMTVRLRNFPANATLGVDCRSSRFGSNWCDDPSYSIRTDGAGNADSRFYYYGYCDDVWVLVNGVRSNTIRWC